MGFRPGDTGRRRQGQGARDLAPAGRDQRGALPDQSAGGRALEGGPCTAAAPDGETLRIRDLDDCKAIVVVASDTADDVPIVNLRVKKAVSKRGAKLVIVHPNDLDLDRWPRAFHVRNEPGKAAGALASLAGHELLSEGPVAILWGDGHGTEDVPE